MCSIRRVLDLNCIRRCILCCVLDGRQNDFVTKLSGLQQILLQQEVISYFVTSLVTGCSRDPVAGGLSMEPPGRTCSVLGRRRDLWVGSCPTVSPTSSGGIHYHILWYRPKYVLLVCARCVQPVAQRGKFDGTDLARHYTLRNGVPPSSQPKNMPSVPSADAPCLAVWCGPSP